MGTGPYEREGQANLIWPGAEGAFQLPLAWIERAAVGRVGAGLLDYYAFGTPT